MVKKEKKSIKEIYDFAMLTEDDAEKLYTLLSQIASEEYIQTLFSEMARKEKQHHKHYLELKRNEIKQEFKKADTKVDLSEEDLKQLCEEYNIDLFEVDENEEISNKIFGKAEVADDFGKLEDLEETLNLFIKYKLKMVIRLTELGKSVRFEDQKKFEEILNEERKSLKELLDMRSIGIVRINALLQYFSRYRTVPFWGRPDQSPGFLRP